MNRADASNLQLPHSIKIPLIDRFDFNPWTVSQVSQTRSGVEK